MSGVFARVEDNEKSDLIGISSSIFRVRRTLLDQFSKIEKDLEHRFQKGTERFASRTELDHVIGNMHSFRKELDMVLSSIEEKIQSSSLSLLGKMRQEIKDQLRQEAIDSTYQPNKSAQEEKWEDWNLGLNPFNLRRKYHEASLSLRAEEVDNFGYDPIFSAFVRPLFDFMYTKYWRVSTFGLSHIPKTGPCLMVGNHSGSLPYDATMLKVAISREHPDHRDLRFMVEDFLFHFPFLGSLMNRFGGVRASQENAEALLNQGCPVVVFPEGVKGLGKLYRERYHLARFGRGGFIRLCLRTKAPLVPVAFIGPEEIHPMIFRETFFARLLGVPYLPITPTFPFLGPLGMIPLPSKWSIHLLPQLDFSQYDAGAEKDRVLVAKLSKTVKEMIQDTIQDQLKLRRSVWF
jgi:1-acyl-sn-glycerol-3-phosphate acyltransferase